ncbi:hypothetical protein XH99_09820 [Bradyrhizobium nanningense]|uniref:Uncharacterized protein n=1 Tax=Bradyrhizobium nanningense TaxID=1325118 RepID=A0A4V1L2P2_9BRAD|nr:hypothetical protein XH99_09820 [Bradyrhizobium nanningense]
MGCGWRTSWKCWASSPRRTPTHRHAAGVERWRLRAAARRVRLPRRGPGRQAERGAERCHRRAFR